MTTQETPDAQGRDDQAEHDDRARLRNNDLSHNAHGGRGKGLTPDGVFGLAVAHKVIFGDIHTRSGRANGIRATKTDVVKLLARERADLHEIDTGLQVEREPGDCYRVLVRAAGRRDGRVGHTSEEHLTRITNRCAGPDRPERAERLRWRPIVLHVIREQAGHVPAGRAHDEVGQKAAAVLRGQHRVVRFLPDPPIVPTIKQDRIPWRGRAGATLNGGGQAGRPTRAEYGESGQYQQRTA